MPSHENKLARRLAAPSDLHEWQRFRLFRSEAFPERIIRIPYKYKIIDNAKRLLQP